MKKINNSVSIFFTLLLLSCPLVVSATSTDISIIDTSNPNYSNGNYQLTDAMALVVHVAQIILQVVGVLTFIMFIYGGFMFLISAGNPKSVETAKKIIFAAVIGLVIVFVSYLLVQFFITSITTG